MQPTEITKPSKWPKIRRGQSDRPTSKADAAKRRPPVILDGVLYRRGKLLIGGVAKLGKSFFVGNMAVALAKGETFLKWKPERPLKVLYLDFELDEWELDERLGGMAKFDLPDNITTVNFKPNPELRNRDSLLEFITTQFQPDEFDVIIWDCFYKFAGLDDENANGKQMAEIGQWLDAIVTHTNAAQILIHHFGKGDQGAKELQDRFRGASSLVSEVDGMIGLTNHENDDHFIVESTVRSFTKTDPFVVRRIWPYFTMTTEDATKRRKPGAQSKLSNSSLLAKIPVGENRAISAPELENIAGVAAKNLRPKLKELARNGTIHAVDGRPERYYR